MVSPHTIDRPRCTDRQLLGLEILLSSYHFLRAGQNLCHLGIPATDPNCHPERVERAEGSPCWTRCRLGGKGLALFSKSNTKTIVSHDRAAGGRCIAAGRWYSKAPTIARCPPLGSRGRGPWSGRGSQRVKPRLVSPFEKRRLSPKGQRFLRVVCPKARFYLLRQQRFRVGDPSARSTRSG